MMTPKERAVTALTLGIPDEVPTFELEFQLEKEMFGRPFLPECLTPPAIYRLSRAEWERAVDECVAYTVEVYEALDYCIVPGYGPLSGDFLATGRVPAPLARYLRRLSHSLGGRRMIGFHGDGTFAIPDGNEMYRFAYALSDDPQGVHAQAETLCEAAIARNHVLQDLGVEVLLLCSDYCYNSGPFLSPAMFRTFIAPYLARIIDDARARGLYTIKHTDGNIMPILEDLVACRPHALHSLDPMAGVDIREVKARVGPSVCLCGNVHCAALQTGTEEDVVRSAIYCLTHGKPGGGYIFCTSNIPFQGMDPQRYKLILEVWKQYRVYT